MRALLIYPFFAVIHAAIVFAALVVYRAFYVDSSTALAFLDSFDTTLLGAYTLDDFDQPMRIALGVSILSGACNFFYLFVTEKPGIFGLLKMLLMQLVHADFYMIGTSIAALFIFDGLTAGEMLATTESKFFVVASMWIGLAFATDAMGRFWAFLNSSEPPARGALVVPIEIIERHRR
ncbi:MAG: hypothetical protein R3F56_04435 [Planctomycetota bacterium]